MGREWHWGGGSSSSKSFSSRRRINKQEADHKEGRGRRRSGRGEVILVEEGGGRGRSGTGGGGFMPSGCMCAVFQLFDNFQLVSSSSTTPFKPASFLKEDDHYFIPKGSEAPRNSLELEEPLFPISMGKEDKAHFDIRKKQMGIQIKTKASCNSIMEDHKRSTSKALKGGQPNESETSINSDSPSTKTPTLVARLMGLDLLPDPSSSPCSPSTLSRSLGPTKPAPFRAKPSRSYYQETGASSHRDLPPAGTRSLPETPRISSARRSDVDHHHHRLSLQINKENMAPAEEVALSRISFALKQREDQLADGLARRRDECLLLQGNKCTSPGSYARQIVKQVKESVSRRVGLDITNTVSNRKVSSRSGNSPRAEGSTSTSTASTCSPRLAKAKLLSDTSNNTTTKDHNSRSSCSINDVGDHYHHHPPRPSLSNNDNVATVLPPVKALTGRAKSQEQEAAATRTRATITCVIGEEKVGATVTASARPNKRRLPVQTATDVIRNKQEEPFVRPARANAAINPLHDKKPKRMMIMPLSTTNMPSPPNGLLLPVKRHPSPPATKIPPKQAPNGQEPKRSSQLSRPSSQSYRLQEATTRVCAANTIAGTKPNLEGTTHIFRVSDDSVAAVAAEYDYISRVLKRNGVDRDSDVSLARWFSPTHPLDPSIFYYLEHFTGVAAAHPGQLSQRSNRKLLFQLVDEMLVDMLRPSASPRPWAGPNGGGLARMKGSELVGLLCARARSFPGADCRVLEDIDGLIEVDMRPPLVGPGEPDFQEEEDGVVGEVEDGILETLVHEVAVVLNRGGVTSRAWRGSFT